MERESYLQIVVRELDRLKKLSESALAQLDDGEYFRRPSEAENSVATIVKHVSGNMRSRWRDFLTSDGEKPDRHRDGEFEMPAHVSRDEVLGWWESGWAIALAAIEALAPEDLERTVTIRGEAFLVVEALNRSAAHTAYHVGQIVYLARHFAGAKWQTLSIPKGRSAEFAKGTFKQGIGPR